MLHSGDNVVDGLPVRVERKRIRRINLRVDAEGTVRLSIPMWWATLAEGEAFLREKWDWVLKTRETALANPRPVVRPVDEAELEELKRMLEELNKYWAMRLGEPPFAWKVRRMKSIWGSCHWAKRVITYNSELAHHERELVEYVVVHEITHFHAHNHGDVFYRMMSERLPNWKDLRRKLSRTRN